MSNFYKTILVLETKVYKRNGICAIDGSAKVLYEGCGISVEGTGESVEC